MNEFLLGAVAMGFLTVAFYFLRFWQRTRDTLFLLFSISFFVQAVSNTVFALIADPTEGRAVFYLPRLVAYALILAAIAGKNLRPGTVKGDR
ncbi:MAG TPA: DUF5985 family protein [Polyangiaceae bacterium]|nr:DUF5985 family protein [Polyangiaceae bacterium]